MYANVWPNPFVVSGKMVSKYVYSNLLYPLQSFLSLFASSVSAETLFLVTLTIRDFMCCNVCWASVLCCTYLHPGFSSENLCQLVTAVQRGVQVSAVNRLRLWVSNNYLVCFSRRNNKHRKKEVRFFVLMSPSSEDFSLNAIATRSPKFRAWKTIPLAYHLMKKCHYLSKCYSELIMRYFIDYHIKVCSFASEFKKRKAHLR